MKAIVTGAAGFIGFATTKELLRQTLFFRISDYIRRIIYGLQPSGLKFRDRVKK